MRNKLIYALAVVGIVTAGAAYAETKKVPTSTRPDPTVSFATTIQPIIQTHCVSCHQNGVDGFIKSGLDLTSYDGLMKGTRFGPVVVAGEPTLSNLLTLIDGRADKSLKMPHNSRKKLPWRDRNMVRIWITQGAKNN